MPPITRRGFLADSAKASAVLALGGSSVGSLLSACGTSSSSSEATTLAVEIDAGQNANPFMWYANDMQAAVMPLDRRRQQVHPRLADEAGDEGVGRARVDIVGRPQLLQHAVLHHRDRVRHAQGIELVVGDDDHRRLEHLLQPLDFAAHGAAQHGVQAGDRFVQKIELRSLNDGAGQGDSLLLTA